MARICAMVPPPRFHMVRFYGVLAPNSGLFWTLARAQMRGRCGIDRLVHEIGASGGAMTPITREMLPGWIQTSPGPAATVRPNLSRNTETATSVPQRSRPPTRTEFEAALRNSAATSARFHGILVGIGGRFIVGWRVTGSKKRAENHRTRFSRSRCRPTAKKLPRYGECMASCAHAHVFGLRSEGC
jgi:hypothetical protein